MTEKTALDFALDMFSVTLTCECGRSWSIKSKRVRPLLQTVCPKCHKVDQLDEPTAVRINLELNTAMKHVADRLGVAPIAVPMPKYRRPRRLRREPKGYPVGVVGESFYQPAIREMFIGDLVKIEPEPTNPHDAEALVVRSRHGKVIGYIPRQSFLMRLYHQEGGTCSARIFDITRNEEEGASYLGVVLDVMID